MSKLRGARLENEVEKCRAESNWRRLQELLPQIRAKGSGLEHLSNFLLGEWLLEDFVDAHPSLQGGFPIPDHAHLQALKKPERYLLLLFDDEANLKSFIAVEAHLLLAKIYYIGAEFDKAISSVQKARLDQEEIQFRTLRTLRLVAEAYSIKGLALERQGVKSTSKYQKSLREEQIMSCFEKAADLAISYIQELDKAVQSAGGTPACGERIGHLMETALQRVPLMYIQQGNSKESSLYSGLKNKCLERGIEQYRKVLTVTDRPLSQELHQQLNRQLAEVVLRGVPEGVYLPPTLSHAVGAKAQHLRFYKGTNFFCPNSRLEEVLLVLSISEAIAVRESVLSRAEEDETASRISHLNVKAVHNLLTLVLCGLRQFQLLAGVLEKALKLAFADRFVWTQLALALICYGRHSRASLVLQEAIHSAPQDTDPQPFMFAAKLSIENLGHFDQGIKFAEKAIILCRGGWLTGRAQLLRGLGLSLKAQTAGTYAERKQIQKEALDAFEDATTSDPKDHLPVFFLALQSSIVRDLDEAKKHCLRSLEMEPEQPAGLMLLSMVLSAERQLPEALDTVEAALLDFPSHYGLLVLRLKLEMALEKTEDALMTAKELLFFWKTSTSGAGGGDGGRVTSPGHLAPLDSQQTRGSSVGLSSGGAGGSNLLLQAAIARSQSGVDVTDRESVLAGAGGALSEFGGVASTVSDSLGLTATSLTNSHLHWRVQANIWLELAEMYLEVGRVEDVGQCVEEAVSVFPNSHHTLYLKGRILQQRLSAAQSAPTETLTKLRAETKACFLGSLALFPQHLPSLRQLAAVYQAEGNLRMAEKVLGDVVCVDPLEERSWSLLANVLSEQGRFPDAANCFSTAALLQQTAPILPFSVIPRMIHLQ